LKELDKNSILQISLLEIFRLFS